MPPDLPVYFLRPKSPAPALTYRPRVMGLCNLHFVDAKSGVDVWQLRNWLAPFAEEAGRADWGQAERAGDLKRELDRTPASGAAFEQPPAGALNAKACARWKATLADFINQNVTLDLYACPSLKLTSLPDETEGAFRARLALAARERRDGEIDQLRARYAPKLQALEDRLRRAEERVERETSQYGQRKLQTALAFGSTLLSALMGRRVFSRAGTAIRSAGQIGKEKADVARADESAELVQQRRDQLNAELEQEVAELAARLDPAALAIATTRIRPRKSDISIGDTALVWAPFASTPDGTLTPA